MKRVCDHLLVVSITLWVGAMWSVGYIVAPTLFSMIADRGLAGNVAGRLFAIVGWIGIASALYVLVFMLVRLGSQALRDGLFWLVAALLLMTLASQYGIQPMMARMKADAWPREVMQSVMRERFATWHGISSILYLIQSVLAIPLIVGVRRLLR
jgi:predicted cobalt transporter CbtA